MVRKRKTAGGPKPKGARGVNKSDASIKKWKTRDDIPLDEEEQYHANRDKILLDEDEDGEMDDLEEDEEVFAMKGVGSEDDEGEEEYQEEEAGENEEPEPPKKKTKKAKSKASSSKTKEVDEEKASASEEEEEGWGKKKSAYYSSNAAQLDSDDEEGNELEEQEVRRLQAKAREAVDEEDFGFVPEEELAVEGEEPEIDVLEEPAVASAPVLPADKASVLRQLEKTNPESLALAREWTDIIRNFVKVDTALKIAENESNSNPALGLMHLHHQAMLTYLTVLSFYLHLRSSPHYASQPHLLKNHPIMGRLLTLKQGLSTLEDLNFAAGGGDRDDSDEDGDEIKAMRKEQLWGEGLGGLALERGELEELLKESENWGEDSVTVEPGTPQKAEKKTKKKKKSKSQESSKPLYDLVEPAFISSHASSSALSSTEDDAFGDPLALSHTDQTDKATRRKSLKFHTSKIESASRKKEGKRKNIVGGDDDIPWEKRDKEKEKETKKRGELGMGGDDLEMEGEEVQEKRGKRSREELDDEEGGVAEEDDEGYYDLVRKQKKAKKEEKKEAYEAEREAQRIDPVTLSTSDPRSITRAIMKNKGLTPHRSKSVRNPRVKKRMKFEEAKKKVASKKAVYKGGLEASGGRYEGEKTGISTKVKSVRLG